MKQDGEHDPFDQLCAYGDSNTFAVPPSYAETGYVEYTENRSWYRRLLSAWLVYYNVSSKVWYRHYHLMLPLAAAVGFLVVALVYTPTFLDMRSATDEEIVDRIRKGGGLSGHIYEERLLSVEFDPNELVVSRFGRPEEVVDMSDRLFEHCIMLDLAEIETGVLNLDPYIRKRRNPRLTRMGSTTVGAEDDRVDDNMDDEPENAIYASIQTGEGGFDHVTVSLDSVVKANMQVLLKDPLEAGFLMPKLWRRTHSSVDRQAEAIASGYIEPEDVLVWDALREFNPCIISYIPENGANVVNLINPVIANPTMLKKSQTSKASSRGDLDTTDWHRTTEVTLDGAEGDVFQFLTYRASYYDNLRVDFYQWPSMKRGSMTLHEWTVVEDYAPELLGDTLATVSPSNDPVLLQFALDMLLTPERFRMAILRAPRMPNGRGIREAFAEMEQAAQAESLPSPENTSAMLELPEPAVAQVDVERSQEMTAQWGVKTIVTYYDDSDTAAGASSAFRGHDEL